MKRSGFTLAEILIAMLLGAAVCAIVVQAAGQAVKVMERVSARALAWERGQNALSIIEPRALHAALGIPSGGELFSSSFESGKRPPTPSKWKDRGPLHILDGDLFALASDDKGVFRGSRIAILYAVPGALRAESMCRTPLSEDAPVAVKLIPGAPGVDVRGIENRLPTEDENDLRSWVAFPLTGLPMYAELSEYSPDRCAVKLTVTAYASFDLGLPAMIYPYDEIHYLRAERFYVQNEIMYSEELGTSRRQTDERLNGVLAMWFEWTPSKKLLDAWVLTSGGRGSSVRPKEWPEGAAWDDGFRLHDVMVVRGSWVLKNM